MDKSFRPRPGRFGVMPVTLGIAAIGGANYLGGATPLTANDTTIFPLNAPPGKSVFYSFAAHTTTVPSDVDGTIVARVRKYDAAADAWVTVSADIDLEALITRERVEVLATPAATPAQLIAFSGDTYAVHVVSNSAAIDTQPVGLCFTVQVLMLE